MNTKKKPMARAKPKLEPLRSGMKIHVKMGIGEKDIWNFQARSALDALAQAEKICKEQGKHFHQDITIWEFTRGETT